MKQINSELVGLIYDAALEPNKWAELLAALSKQIGPYEDKFQSAGQQEITSDYLILQQHIERAFTIAERVESLEKTNQVNQSIADLLPIPAMIIDDEFNLLSCNESFHSILSLDSLFHINNSVFSSNSNTLMFKLKEHIATLAVSSNIGFLTLRAQSTKPHKPTSLLISKLNSARYEDSYLLLVASSQSQNYISETMLAEMYSLTKAEQKLAAGIARGESLQEIASSNNNSIHTVRTQLKTIFSKVGVNRQSELMRTLLTSSLLNFDSNKPSESEPAAIAKRDDNVKRIRLQDGRNLSYSEYGDEEGEPTFVFHPTTGSRLQCHPNDELTRSHGVRMIVVDRPGFGLSSRHVDRNLVTFSNDIKQLADSLGLSHFSLLGYCGGGPYALSCAYHLDARVKQLTVVSGVTPYESIDLLHGASTFNRLLVKIAIAMPDSIFHLASILAKKIVSEPEIYLDELQGQLCENDRSALNEPEFLDNFMTALTESLRQGPTELAREQLLFSQQWGFDFEKIQVPTDLWYGDLDKHVPIQLAKQLASNLKQAEFHHIENYGHFMIYHKWSEILEQHMSKLNLVVKYGT